MNYYLNTNPRLHLTGIKDKDFDQKHLQKNRYIIQSVLNKIIEMLCDGISNVDSIKDDILSDDDIIKLCKIDKSDCSSDEPNRFFTETRLTKIIKYVKDWFYNPLNRSFCKLKTQTVYTISPSYLYFTYPVNPVIYNPIIYNPLLWGGNKKPKFIDFDGFMAQYEKYHKVSEKKNINIKICKKVDDKINCINKIIKLSTTRKSKIISNFLIPSLDSNLDSEYNSGSELYSGSESELNVKKNGIDEKLERAYKRLKRYEQLESLEERLDSIDIILKYLEYYILPLKTIKKGQTLFPSII